jgi:hypothetical protein
MKNFIKWLGNISVFIYAAVMFFGNIIMTIVVTEFAMGAAPILVFNVIMILLYLMGILSRFVK